MNEIFIRQRRQPVIYDRLHRIQETLAISNEPR
jgi:hypothetical protein